MAKGISMCPVCGSVNSRLFDKRFFKKVFVINRICEDCGLVYQSPRLTIEEANEFHKNQYRQIHQAGFLNVDPREIAFQTARAKALLGIFSNSINYVYNHLDIGCSSGFLMRAFEKYYGCRTTGVEIDPMYRFYALHQGLQVIETLDDLPNEVKFDVISMSHVLEHVPEPVEFLINIRRNFMEPNGWLFLEVPNLYSHDCFEPGHLISFSKHTLVQVLNKAGYRVNRLVYHGKPRSKIVPLYINVLARPSEYITGTLKGEKLVYIKRKAGRVMRRIVEYFFPGLAKLQIP
jgi:2-polyprenyl-3-methyl-5-hydroxy-6-metoxy-1,4-benzoquinol methylase